MDKYICPECGSQLYAWKEFICEKRVMINKKTGKPYKKIIKTELEENVGMIGLKCTNDKCHFLINGVFGNLDDNLKYLNEIDYESTLD